MRFIEWLRDGLLGDRARYRKASESALVRRDRQDREDPSGRHDFGRRAHRPDPNGQYQFGNDPTGRMVPPHAR